MKKKMFKRIMSAVLTWCMVVALIHTGFLQEEASANTTHWTVSSGTIAPGNVRTSTNSFSMAQRDVVTFTLTIERPGPFGFVKIGTVNSSGNFVDFEEIYVAGTKIYPITVKVNTGGNYRIGIANISSSGNVTVSGIASHRKPVDRTAAIRYDVTALEYWSNFSSLIMLASRGYYNGATPKFGDTFGIYLTHPASVGITEDPRLDGWNVHLLTMCDVIQAPVVAAQLVGLGISQRDTINQALA